MASTSSASSPSASRPTSLHVPPAYLDSVPVEALVQHLLDAKRSLSSMRLVLRANELVHVARQAHEESVILSAQTQFLRRGISEQMRLLLRIRKDLMRTYDDGKREFKQIIKTLDVTNSRLEEPVGGHDERPPWPGSKQCFPATRRREAELARFCRRGSGR